MHWLHYGPHLWVLWLHEEKGWYPKEMKLSYLNPSFREFEVWDCFFWVKGEQAWQKTFNCRLSESSGRTYSSPEKTWRIAFTVSRILHEINFFLVVVKFSRNLKCLNISLHETNKSKFTSNFHNWHVFGVIKRDNSDPLQEKYIII